ncbi:MAG: alpha-glucan family phosphorylase, partial [Gemmatimonadota bacterium]
MARSARPPIFPQPMNTSRRQQEPAVAYFSMEIALDPRMPTYSGGLGVLAGDILRSAADLGVPMIGVTLIHRKGYYQQELDEEGNQIESSHDWRPEDLLEPLEPVVSVEIEEREVHLRVWQFLIQGVDTHSVPVLLLDAALPENTPWDRSLTDQLYGGDEHYRLCQEALLGLGGVAALTALGYDSRILYHMNEGHSALLTIPLLETAGAGRGGEGVSEGQIEAVRKNCVFTTHTPVPAGHDQFPIALVRQVLGPARTALLHKSECLLDDTLNMTYLALRFSGYINGVSMRHGEVSFDMFPGYPIHAITNGVHVVTWTCEAFQKLYDEHIPGWRFDTRYLRYAIQIPHEKIQESHRHAKHKLLAAVESRSGIKLGEDVFTIAFARRATPYKRADLLLRDPGR